MSFVNLMGNDRWSEADIVNRTENMIRSEVSEAEEIILSRKMHGYTSGRIVPTAEEAALLDRFEAVSRAAQMAGFEAREDMALLASALDFEQAVARLAQPQVVETIDTVAEDGAPLTLLNPAWTADLAERAAAQVVIDQVCADAIALVTLRAEAMAPAEDGFLEMEAD